VELNHLQNRIRIVGRQASDKLIPLDDLGADSVDFVMTNPPFYLSEDELLTSAKQKSRPPFSACTGATVEMVCEGGEVGFVGRILDESLILRGRVQWYTSMLGKQSSLEKLVEMLHAKGIDNYALTEFVQGNKTRRWAIGWTFAPMRPSQTAARGLKAAMWKKILPPVVEAEVVNLPTDCGIGRLGDNVNQLLSALELILWSWDRERLCGIGRARQNVWSRAWRRRKLRETPEECSAAVSDIDDEACAFGFRVSIHVSAGNVSVSCRWLEGYDNSIFESFVGFLKTKLMSV
jgi:23S rRNA (adenine1618-N6)-methyltransferase